MPHGLPDFGVSTPKETTFNLVDLADLAVRLGSIVEYDRRGDVIYLDDCEAPVPRFRDTSTGTGTAKLNTEAAYSGVQSIKLLPEETIGKVARVQYYLNPLVTGKHGIKISPCLYRLHNRRQLFDVAFSIFTGAYSLVGGIEIIPNAKTIAYWNPDGEAVVFEENFVVTDTYAQQFHNIKLVIDLDTGKYVRLLYDTFSWDMSEYSYSKTSEIHAPQNEAHFYMECGEVFADYMWLDNFVYTINEP